MKKLVTISREYGSGGRIIGGMVAEKLGVPMYDKELIDFAAERSGLSREIIESAELRAKSSFTYTLSSVIGFGDASPVEGLSVNEKLFQTQFDIISQIGELGNAVIVGRCADYILKEIQCVTNVFLYAEMEDRIRRCIDVYGDDPAEVRKKIETYDKARANYYNYHTLQKWGYYKNYNLCINTSRLSEENVADMIVDYVMKRNDN